ncbi:MAG: shikimate kinase [Candidatus Rifleibacteriota bacterium]
MIFILTGFMAAGKTTVGKRAALSLSIPFYDLDDLIEARASQKIHDIFATSGESAFRKIESEIFAELLKSCPDECLISVGGGLIISDENFARISSSEVVIFLDEDFEPIKKRIRADRTIRPVARDLNDQQLKALYERRRRIYLERSGFIVKNEIELVNLIKQQLNWKQKND